MNHKRPPLPAIVIILLLIAVSVYFIVTQSAADENGALTASGSIEATTVNVAPEMAGKVVEVLVDEGQLVQAGHEFSSSGPDFYSYNYFEREAPMIMLSAKINFNNYKTKRDNGQMDNQNMGNDEF